jgi:two-component system NtrC family sensor kinase
MKPGRGKNPAEPPFTPELAGLPASRAEGYASLLADFPDAVVITDQQKKVVFVNGAAQQLFKGGLRPGDSCPICSKAALTSGFVKAPESGGRCPAKGGKLHRAPIFLEASWPAGVPITVTASPVKWDGNEAAGCFLVLRPLHDDLMAHPAVQLQTATLTSILENFPQPFFIVSPDLKLIHMNDYMAELTGYSREEAVGKMTCGCILNTVQCTTEDCVLQQVMRTRTPISGLRRKVRDRQGREIPVVVSASIITDAAGQVIGGFEAVRDISARVEAEKKIELLTDLTKEGILMVDEQQRILFANSRMAEIVGGTKEGLIGNNLGEVLTSQHLKIAAELSAMAADDRQVELQFCSTLDQHRPEEDSRVFETYMTAARIGDKTISCLYLRDLTDRIIMERELQKTNNFLNNIIRCSVDGIVVVDPKGVPLIFNEGAERILGYTAEEVIGHSEIFRSFYPIEVAAEMMRRMRSDDFGPPDKLNTTQLTFINKNGEEVPVNFSAAIVRERGEEVASVGIFSDLRETLKMRQELEESQAQLLHSEKIASLGRLAAGVAHEINNPLAGILIYAELLQRELAAGSESRQHVAVIIEQILRCQQIVTRLLEFSRQSLGQKILFDVNDIIVRCTELIGHQAFFHNIEIVRDLDRSLPQLLGNAGELQQVFTNLLLNAADAMNHQGLITIVTRPAPWQEGVVISFTDTGSGIPLEIRDKIFEPFFTTKPPGKGTGLGLSIVYGVIQRHGGTIEVESPPGGGTTFTVKLPLDSPDQVEQFELS